MTSHCIRNACASLCAVPKNGHVIVNYARRSPLRSGTPRRSKWSDTRWPGSPLNFIVKRSKSGVSPINYPRNNKFGGDVSPRGCSTDGPLVPTHWMNVYGVKSWMTLLPTKKPIGPGLCDGFFDICVCVPGRLRWIFNVSTVPWGLVTATSYAWVGMPSCGPDA